MLRLCFYLEWSVVAQFPNPGLTSGKMGNMGILLRPKMNCTVRFGKKISESSPCLPGQQGWHASGTLRKQFTKPTVQFILGRSTYGREA